MDDIQEEDEDTLNEETKSKMNSPFLTNSALK